MLSKTKFIPLAIALAFAGGAGAQEVIKIGHVAPVSGPSAHLGKDNENGAKMAVEELNAKGIKINGKPVKFVLVLEDFHERESRRLRDVQHLVADMNHHVRNALQVITYANATSIDGKFTEQVRDSIERIDWALREVLGERATRLGAQPLPSASALQPERWTNDRRASSREPHADISNEKGPQ